MSNMGNIFGASAESLSLDLKKARLSFSHSGVKGDASEEAFRSFLRGRLPASIGVVRGQVVDCTGALSRQADTILYDAMRTPMLFKTADDGHQLVPAEGVLAVIEVKSRLKSQDLSGIIEHCRSVKSLKREAYFGEPRRTFDVYDRQWNDHPIYYSVFGFESENLYAEPLNELMLGIDLQMRIDSVCCLDRGINLNSRFTGDTGNPVGIFPTPTSFGGLLNFETPNALLLWFLSLSSVIFQSELRPIDLMKYASDETVMDVRVPAGRTGLQMSDFLVETIAARHKIERQIIDKHLRGEPLNAEELTIVDDAGLHYGPVHDGPTGRAGSTDRWKLIGGEFELGPVNPER